MVVKLEKSPCRECKYYMPVKKKVTVFVCEITGLTYQSGYGANACLLKAENIEEYAQELIDYLERSNIINAKVLGRGFGMNPRTAGRFLLFLKNLGIVKKVNTSTIKKVYSFVRRPTPEEFAKITEKLKKIRERQIKNLRKKRSKKKSLQVVNYGSEIAVQPV